MTRELSPEWGPGWPSGQRPRANLSADPSSRGEQRQASAAQRSGEGCIIAHVATVSIASAVATYNLQLATATLANRVVGSDYMGASRRATRGPFVKKMLENCKKPSPT